MPSCSFFDVVWPTEGHAASWFLSGRSFVSTKDRSCQRQVAQGAQGGGSLRLHALLPYIVTGNILMPSGGLGTGMVGHPSSGHTWGALWQFDHRLRLITSASLPTAGLLNSTLCMLISEQASWFGLFIKPSSQSLLLAVSALLVMHMPPSGVGLWQTLASLAAVSASIR